MTFRDAVFCFYSATARPAPRYCPLESVWKFDVCLKKRWSGPQGRTMNTRFYDRPDRRGFGLGLGPVLQAALVGRPPPPNFMPSSTPFFTSCGQAASGDYCHANFRLGARSTITFEPGKTPVCGSIYIGYSTSRPVVMRDEKTVLRGWSWMANRSRRPSVVVLVVSTHTSGSRDANATSWSTLLGYRLPIVSSRLNTSDRRAGALLLGGLSALSPGIRTVIAGAGHESRKFARTLKQNQGRQLQIVNRRQRAFKITGLTWIVERSFALAEKEPSTE